MAKELVWINHNVAGNIEVEIMAKSGKYWMVRRKGCMPFVCYETDKINRPVATDKVKDTTK